MNHREQPHRADMFTGRPVHNPPERPTLEEVQSVDRPIVVGPSGLNTRGHKPVLVNDELDIKCDQLLTQRYEIQDHFDVRKVVSPCSNCFRDGFPFEYEMKQIEPYASMSGTVTYSPVNIPDSLLPNDTVYLGRFDQ